MIDLSLSNHYRRATIERKNDALKLLTQSVVQIFGAEDRAERRFPVSAGTGTLIRLANRRFLVTAAHVIDAAKKTTLYAGINGVLVEIDGTAFVTSSENRDTDVFDFAFLEIEGELARASKDLSFLGKENFYYGHSEPNLTVYMALGFPRSKNKKRDIPGRKVRNRRWSFTSRKATNFDHARVGTSADTHIPVMFARDSFISEANLQTNAISPKGLSGGPLLNLGNAGHPEYYVKANRPALVSGILIEERDEQSAVLAVRIGTILREIGKKFPDVKRELPGVLD